MIIEIILLILILYILYAQHRLHQGPQQRDADYNPIIPMPTDTIPTPLPAVTPTRQTDKTTIVEVTPVWYESVKAPSADKIILPKHYRKDSPVLVRTFECLSLYRSMNNKNKLIDFVHEPFSSIVDETETVVVVLNELVQHLGARLSFTEKAFQYEDSAYRTACGVGSLASIHSMLGAGKNIQTAKFKLHLRLAYDSVTSSAETLHRFTISLINDLADLIGCKKEFIRVFSVSRASSINVECGITTPEFQTTEDLAYQFQDALNHLSPSQTQNILQYLIPEHYDFKLESALSVLQLQESDFSPEYNREYTEAEEEIRGGRPYYFPEGWCRHALNVTNKFGADQTWLGMNNSPGEWAVAYHGTKAGVVKNIAKIGLKHEFVTADVCKDEAEANNPSIPKVKGLYVATHCEGGASVYTKGFEVPNSSGTSKTYRVVFQCRVENGKFTEHTGPVNVGLALRVFDENAIRPYGILLKCVSDEGDD